MSISSLPSHTSPKSIDPLRSDSDFPNSATKNGPPRAGEGRSRNRNTCSVHPHASPMRNSTRPRFRDSGQARAPTREFGERRTLIGFYLRQSSCEDLAGTFTCSPWGPQGPDNLSGYARGIDENRTFVLKQQVEHWHMARFLRPTLRRPSLLAPLSHRPYNCCRFS